MSTRYNYTGGLITEGLVLNLDAAKRDSYPGSGTLWKDLSGNGNNGTLTNGPTYTGVSKDSSIVFDGVDDFVSVESSPLNFFSNLSSYSISFWVKITSYGGNGSVLLSSPGINNLFFQVQSGTVYIGIIGTTNNFLAMSIPMSSLTLNIISNMVWVKDSTAAYFYLNSTKFTFPGTANFNFVGSGNTINIGKYTTPNFNLPGSIYNTQIYNRALTQPEITQNFNALRGRYLI